MSKFSSLFKNEITCPSPLQEFTWQNLDYEPTLANSDQYHFYCKRDDLIHPTISGNKWRKLQGVLSLIQNNCPTDIISFGGGYSNHLHALAYLCQKLNIPFTAIIRGNYQYNKTPMITDIESWGASIKYVNKLEYKLRGDETYLSKLAEQYVNALIIPEGGSSKLCFDGMGVLMKELTHQLTALSTTSNNQEITHNYIVLPVASAGTLSGLINAVHLNETSVYLPNHCETNIDVANRPIINTSNTTVIGIAVLKGKGYLENLTTELLNGVNYSGKVNWFIEHEYNCGGYAKSNTSLNVLINHLNTGELIRTNEFKAFNSQPNLTILQKNITVEHVYSGKVFYAITDMLKNKRFQSNSRIIALHTGGLQGARQ